MSKMSEIHRELEERLSELGYSSVEEAIEDEMEVNYV